MKRVDPASVVEEIGESIEVKDRLKDQANLIYDIGVEAAEAIARGGKILLFGNGGSAADAQHIAGELVGRFKRTRRALPAIALTTDSSILTAISNDFAFEQVFARQVEALASKGDMAIGISTSGRSRNVINAILAANRLNVGTVGLTGGDGGELAKFAHRVIVVPSHDTQRIQESHIMIGHILCRIIEQKIVGRRR